MENGKDILERFGNGLHQIAKKRPIQYGTAVALLVPGLMNLKELLFNEEYVRDMLLTWREKIMTEKQFYAKYPLSDLNDVVGIFFTLGGLAILGERLWSDKESIKYLAREISNEFSSKIINPVKKISRRITNNTIAMYGYNMLSR
jgi:hypothetical protein